MRLPDVAALDAALQELGLVSVRVRKYQLAHGQLELYVRASEPSPMLVYMSECRYLCGETLGTWRLRAHHEVEQGYDRVRISTEPSGFTALGSHARLSPAIFRAPVDHVNASQALRGLLVVARSRVPADSTMLIDLLDEAEALSELLADFETDRTEEIVERFERIARRYPGHVELQSAAKTAQRMRIRCAP